MFDNSPLLPGERTQAFAKATDAFGNEVPARSVTWRSLDPSIATVSPSGQVTALAPGSVLIEGKVSTVAGLSPIMVSMAASPPPAPPPPSAAAIISANFDDGTLGGFKTWDPRGNIVVMDDPTGSGRGKVARLRYYNPTYGDDNTSLVQPTANGPPSNEAALHIGAPGRYYEFDFYIPPDVTPRMNLGGGFAQKLLYIKESHHYGGNHYFRFVVGVFGTELSFASVFSITTDHSQQERVDKYFPIGITGGRWYSLKVYLKRESAVGVKDGVLSVWLDGVRYFHNTEMRWSHPSWLTQNLPGTNRPTVPSDLYMDNVLIGQQVNTTIDTPQRSYDLYRYIDNVKISW